MPSSSTGGRRGPPADPTADRGVDPCTVPTPRYIRGMDAGFLRRLMTAPTGRGTDTDGGMRDHVLAALLAAAAASGGRLTQARVLALRVGEVSRVLVGLPFSAKVSELVRELARRTGLSDEDPVVCSRKRGADGLRRPVSRVQAYRIVRGRTGSGWSGTVRRLVAGPTASAAVAPRPPARAPVRSATAPVPAPRSVRDMLGLWSSPPAPHPRR
jgi:hypothetical protein